MIKEEEEEEDKKVFFFGCCCNLGKFGILYRSQMVKRRRSVIVLGI